LGQEEGTEQGEVEEKKVPAASKMLAAFAGTGESSEDDKPKKGKKHQQNKKDRQQKKGKKKADSEDEAEPESTAAPDEEEKVAEVPKSKPQFPLEVIYCRICGVPPEYCMFDKKDSSECKAWV